MKRVLFYLGKGSSTSKQTSPDSDSDSASKMRWPVFSGKKIVAGPHPDDATTGSKDEAFFDSQAWLESDNEDFYSIQGETSPSLKESPVHQKKSLSELFCESFERTRHIDQNVFLDQKHGSPNEDTPDAAAGLQRRKSPPGSARYCFPGLMRSLSCKEWKKKRLSPVHVA